MKELLMITGAERSINGQFLGTMGSFFQKPRYLRNT